MLQVQKVSKSYGVETVLDEVSFVINPGERAALTGPNGSGKSTLLRIITGELAPDSGSVAFAPGIVPAYLPQGFAFDPGATVGSAVWGTAYESARDALRRLEAEMETANGETLAHVLDAYGEASERFEALGGYDLEWRAEEVLAHLGLNEIDPETPCAQLSGGQQTRLGLAGLLIKSPTLLILDEPTNHLDIEALEWLEGFLSQYRGAALIVSHDRVFLDRTVNRVIAIDGETRTISEYTGGYSDYVEQRTHEIAGQWAAWADQEAEIRRVRQDIAQTKEHSLSVERSTTPRQPGVRRYAKKVAKKALSREKKLDRYLESDERVERPQESFKLKLDFGAMPRGGQDVLMLDSLGHRYGNRWLFRDVTLTLRQGQRIALLGPNGSGKSTLLKSIAGIIQPAEGQVRLGASVQLGYLPQDQEGLNPQDSPLELILHTRPMSETDARTLLHYFLFAGDDVFVPIGGLSYGQRARLLLARMVVSGTNCLILDEPMNHLDIPSRERFEAALASFPGAVLFSGHDRAFIDRFATGIWSMEDGGVGVYVDREEMMRIRHAA